MAYSQVSGRRPFELASKVVHAEIINNPTVQEFVGGCSLPDPPSNELLRPLVVPLPDVDSDLSAVIAVDGSYRETAVRDRFPSASVAFLTFGPLFFNLSDLEVLDRTPFIGPEDMAALKNLERYNMVVPTKIVRPKGAKRFSDGVRWSVQRFLKEKDLLEALRWLLFRGWLPSHQQLPWDIPVCPNYCGHGAIAFVPNGSTEEACPSCGGPVYLADALRLYERIDDELGAASILGYLLTALEQLVLVHLIKSICAMKPALLSEVLFVKDGPLAFFGTTAPLHRPMRELMTYLGGLGHRPPIHLVGLEKSGPFVEHAIAIEDKLEPGDLLVLTNDYIYRYVQPGDPKSQSFGRNTYYGAKVIFKGTASDTYVATIPTGDHLDRPTLSDLFNGAAILRVLSRLRCSMYDNSLLPIALANRLVSLADVPSAEILAKFARDRIRG